MMTLFSLSTILRCPILISAASSSVTNSMASEAVVTEIVLSFHVAQTLLQPCSAGRDSKTRASKSIRLTDRLMANLRLRLLSVALKSLAVQIGFLHLYRRDSIELVTI